MKTCQQIKIRKEQVLQERKTNKELFQSMKEMEKNLTVLQQELQHVKKVLHKKERKDYNQIEKSSMERLHYMMKRKKDI